MKAKSTERWNLGLRFFSVQITLVVAYKPMWFPPAMLAVFVTQRQQQPFCPCIDACLRVFVISCGPFFFRPP